MPSYCGQKSIQRGVWTGSLGPLINGLTHPVFQYFQSASHGTVVTVAIPAAAAAMAEARALGL
jgi:phosphotransacetylase